MTGKGKFVISLDFELFWGVRDKRTIESYGASLTKVHDIVPRMLDLFEEYGIRSTFATVGFLFAKNKKELLRFVPPNKPQYQDANLSPYGKDINELPEEADLYHYAPRLIELLKKFEGQEIATHTFSHYYCLEKGQKPDDFDADMKAARSIAEINDIALDSLVFPRNQFNKEYLKILNNNNISSYRGNENSWFHKSESEESISLKKRVFRTLNCYINIGGHHCYKLEDLKSAKPYNIPSSRFLRPYKAKLPILEWLKLRRIKRSMTHAAKNGLLYHLWWHPHNFGTYQDENFLILEKILKHYQELQSKYGFQSCSMSDVSTLLDAMTLEPKS